MKKLYHVSICLSFCLSLWFADIQAQSFTESSGALGIEHYHHSTNLMGGGIAFFDYDQDGYEDMYATGGETGDVLYRNVGGTHFVNMTNESGLKDLFPNPHRSTSVFTGDLNNDGYPDIFIGRQKLHNLIYLNNGDGTFSDISSSSGMASYVAFTMGGVMGDYNLDGYLDIYVINYVKTPNADNNGFYHECYANWLFLNNGDLTFTEVGVAAGVDDKGCALAVNFTDYNQDNDPDIYVANDFGEWIVPNALLQNKGNGSFLNVSELTNMDVGIYGMGIATGDYNKDGKFDYYVTNLGRNVLMRNMGGNTFTDVTTFAKVENTHAGDYLSTGWGTVFVDYDHDGYEDLFVGNGEIPAAEFIATNIDDPNKLYRNKQDGTFEDVTAAAGVGALTRGRGLAMSDFDKDGDMDVVVAVVDNVGDVENKHLLFYVNESAENRNWLQVKLQGSTVNYGGFGSIIKLYADGEIWLRETGGGGSHASQHGAYSHFGLNQVDQVDSLEVIWVGGTTQTFYDINPNQALLIIEGENQYLVESCENGECTYIDASLTPLETPTDLAVSFAGRDQGLSINWTDASSNESGFHLEKATGDSPADFALLDELQADVTSYSDQAIVAGEQYIYRVKAIGEGSFANSGYSVPDTFVVDTLPSDIDTLYCTFNETSLQNELHWNADTTAVDSFYIERAVGESTTFDVVATKAKDVFTWSDQSIDLDQKYTYRVRSGNRFWYSNYHEGVSIISEISGLGNLSPLNGQIEVFPNPIQNGLAQVSIRGKVLGKPMEVLVQDLTGRILMRRELNFGFNRSESIQRFDLKAFGAGNYFIQFRSEYGVYTAKVVYFD